MKKILLVLLCGSFFVAGNIQAKEEILAVITNDENHDVMNLVASSDDVTQSLKSFYKDDYANGQKTERELLPTKELLKEGVILDKRGDRTVINLKSDNFDFEQGGTITIDTLYNGVTGERKQYEIEIAKDGNNWKLFNKDNIVSKLHIEVNKKAFIGTIGVKNIRMD
jgi:hypothetical protein